MGNWNGLEDDEMEEETYLDQGGNFPKLDKQVLFERFLNASFELKAEIMHKLFQDGTYLSDKEQEFSLALSEWHKSI